LQTDLQKDIWNKKYRNNNETLEEFFNRVSGTNDDIKQLMLNKKFLPAGRILANRGLYKTGKKITYSNCYVLSPPEDNIESIFGTASKLARTYSYGGGVGIDISNLAPRGAKINNAAKETTGSVSFMDLYSIVTGLIGQAGRRGALMISLDCSHPDIEDFIDVKNDPTKVTKANISIRITDEFMKAVKNNEEYELSFIREQTGEVIKRKINAKELFHKIAENNWRMAEPGFLMWDKIKNWSLLSEDKDFEYAGVNPCVSGDTLILTDRSYIRIDSLINQKIKIWNGYEFSEVIPKVTGHNQKMKKIYFSDGSDLICTYYHKFILKNNNRVEAKDLKIGDKLIKCDFPIITEGKSIDDKISYTQGFYLGDGSSESNRDRLSIKLYDEKRKVIDRLIYENVNYCPSFDGEFLTLPYMPDIYNKEFVPETTYDVQSRLNWLSGYIDSDGTLNSSDGSISISSTIKNNLIKVKRLLNTLGCNATVAQMYEEKEKLLPLNDGTDKKGKFKCQQSYRIIINATNVKKLIDLGLNTSRVELIANPNRDASRFIYITAIEEADECETVYCFNEPLNHSGIFNGIITAQCAEEPLPAGGSCLLGSFNFAEYVINPFTNKAEFDFNSFKKDIKTVVTYMNEILDEGLPLHPLQEQRDSVGDWRQIGIGYMGLGDMLIKLGIKYGNPESIILSDQIGFCLINNAIKESSLLAKNKGTYPKYNAESILNSPFFITNTDDETKEIVKNYGLRNSQLLTCAPTGTLSTMLGISGGGEPIYELSYTRKTESLHEEEKYYKIFTPIVEEYLKLQKNTDFNGNQYSDDELPDYFVTAMSLDYKDRIAMQAIWQKHIDASISSTVNVPEEFTIEQVEDLYIKAWEMGLKGVTIFRNNCERVGILTLDEEDEDIFNLERGYIIQTSDDLIGRKRKAMTGCGSLHVEAYFDPGTGDLMEVFLNKGSTGGCHSYMVSLSRMISLSARGGIPLISILDQLNSIPACPSYSVRTAIKKDTSKGNSCPTAIGKLLIEMQKEIWDDLGIEDNLVVDIKQDKPVIIKNIKQKCPECGDELRFESGCNSCPACGYSKCS